MEYWKRGDASLHRSNIPTLPTLRFMIRFGTSGWRGLIAHDFTFDNVRLATQAIANYLNSSAASRPSSLVIVGYDTRFLGREFSLAAAEVLTANGLESWL